MAQQERRRILFVGGVAPHISEQALFEHFSQFCDITKVRIMREKKTRESKGYAYITVADSRSIPLIMSAHHLILGRKLDVQLATSKGEKREWKVLQRCRRVYAVGLPPGTTNEQVAAAFRKFGEVRNAFVIREHESRIKKEYAYIQFDETDAAQLALNSVIKVNGKVITCQPYWSRYDFIKGYTGDSFETYQPDIRGLTEVKQKPFAFRILEEHGSSSNQKGRTEDSLNSGWSTNYQDAMVSRNSRADESASNYRFNLRTTRAIRSRLI